MSSGRKSGRFLGPMGLFDSLLGRTKVEKPTLERLFAISTAQVTLETELDLHPSKTAAICFKPMSSSRFRESGKDIEDMVRDGVRRLRDEDGPHRRRVRLRVAHAHRRRLRGPRDDDPRRGPVDDRRRLRRADPVRALRIRAGERPFRLQLQARQRSIPSCRRVRDTRDTETRAPTPGEAREASFRSRPSSSAGIRYGTPRSRRRKTAEGLWRRPALGPAPGRPRPRDPPAPDRARVVRVARRHLRRRRERGRGSPAPRRWPRRLRGDHREAKPKPPPTLPDGGRTILPAHAGGAPSTERPRTPASARSESARPTRRAGASTPWRRKYSADRPVLPAMELIATRRPGSPGNDGMYRARQSSDLIASYLAAARRAHALLILDIQPGRSPFMREVRAYARWLREPDVGHRARPRVEHGARARCPGPSSARPTRRS